MRGPRHVSTPGSSAKTCPRCAIGPGPPDAGARGQRRFEQSQAARAGPDGDEVTAEHDIERWSAGDDPTEISFVLDSMGSFDAVGHRVVHGGREFRAPRSHRFRHRAPGWPARRSRRCTSRVPSPESRRRPPSASRYPAGCLLRHDVSRDDAGRRVDVRVPAGVARPVGVGAIRLPRPLPRLRVAARGRVGRPGCRSRGCAS